MECKYCNQILKSASSLNQHQKTAKYCLSKQNKEPIKEHVCNFCGTGFLVKSTLNSHLRICKASNPMVQEQLQMFDETKSRLDLSLSREKENSIIFENKIIEKDRIIEEQKLIIKEFQDDQRKQNKDLTDRIQSIAEKAISKPSTVNQNTTTNQIINNMMPITDEHLQEHIHNLNSIHVQNGASGYAKYALEFPLKDMIVCTDFQRRNCKYKDENGNVVSDPEMTKITKRLFSAIKERNEELINEYSAELQAKWRSMNVSANSNMNEEENDLFSSQTNEALEFALEVLSQKRQANEMADGMRPDLFYGFVRELAAGCYKSEK